MQGVQGELTTSAAESAVTSAPSSPLMTTGEVADYLRVKERTIYEMVARQTIPFSRATGKLLFPRRLVDAWLEAQTELPGTGIIRCWNGLCASQAAAWRCWRAARPRGWRIWQRGAQCWQGSTCSTRRRANGTAPLPGRICPALLMS